MKFEKITDTKIKIILSFSDLKLNNISINNIFSNTSIYQPLLQILLKMAEKEIGFKPEDSKLLVEATWTSDKNCIFFITKLDNQNLHIEDYLHSFIFEFNKFEDFNDLCCFLKNIPNINLQSFANNFSLIFYNNTYFLKITNTSENTTFFDYIKIVISEFGKNVSSSFYLSDILNEYGKKIFDSNSFYTYINKF